MRLEFLERNILIMLEANGNLWDLDGYKVITTNGFVKKNGECVMGRGCAKEAAIRYPKLPYELAGEISKYGNHVFFFNQYNLFTFPVKHNWWEVADLKLIKQSAKELLDVFEGKVDAKIFIPKPGCGNGQLTWEQVKPIIEPILKSNNFIIVDF